MKRIIKFFIFTMCHGNVLFSGVADMTLEEKLGQLIVAPGCPSREDKHHREDLKILKERWHIGGIMLKQGTLQQTGDFIERIQEKRGLPLLMVADAEWGLSMRVSDALRYPRNMTLGAVQDLTLLEQMGQEVGEEMRWLGIHLNLAPVVDINSNPKNPIIYTRSFGDSRQEVAARALVIMKGMQKAGVLACAKHFPGHGDTSIDSHIALPFIDKDFSEMQTFELYPFKALVDHDVACVMTAHLMIPKVDQQPVTVSKRWVTDILRGQLGFSGLIITDALNMAGIARDRSPGEVAVGAFLAGHDLLLYGDHIAPNIDEILEIRIPAALTALKQAVKEGVIAEEEVDRRVEKILKVKTALVQKSETKPTSSSLPPRLYEEALTQIGTLPHLETASVIQVGLERPFDVLLKDKGIEVFEEAAWKVVVLGDIERATNEKKEAALTVLEKLKLYEEKVVVVLFGSPYNLVHIPKEWPVVIGYEDVEWAWKAAAAALAGEISCKGCLPIQH
ncbi:MAG: hypothetical protein KGZ39_06970 [Simkania sp.]|nr:hypothetical protein [Simkania sp.]